MAIMRGQYPEAAGRPVKAGTDVRTVIVGAGQAGLATSYWLKREGIDHVLFERRHSLGGGWQDRWDSFCLNTPNYGITLPGMPYTGPDPDGFMLREDVVDYLRRYAGSVGAPVQTDTDVTRVSATETGFGVETSQGNYRARNVVLASGAYPKPKTPAAAATVPAQIHQLHAHDYRNPSILPDGAVLVVGTGQSGGQIAEELLEAGREVHLAVSSCPEAPRRYRGQDLFYWLMQLGLHGSAYGFAPPGPDQLPSPAARFACNSLFSGRNGGHDICLRELGSRGIRLHGRFEGADDGALIFSDDVEDRLRAAESSFSQRPQPVIDAYIAAAGINAPADDRAPHTAFTPDSEPRLRPETADLTSIIWATGYQLDFSWLDLPVLDEWGYPRHDRGVTDHPGLYVVGLPWLTSQGSSLLAGVGGDAAYISEHLCTRQGI